MYTGTDPVTNRRLYLREVVPAEREAREVLRRLGTQVDERRNPRTSATVDQPMRTYAGYADKHVRPLIDTVKVGALDGDGSTASTPSSEAAACTATGRPPHLAGARVRRPMPCARLQAARRVAGPARFTSSSAGRSAGSPVALAGVQSDRPRGAPAASKPNPTPPSPAEAARILAEAWKDPEWGVLVWLVMVTGLRRGELCSIRWRDFDLERGTLMLASSIGQRGRVLWEKGPKSHQHRRLALDPESVELLVAHRGLCASHADALGVHLTDDAFVFRSPDGSTHLVPDSVSPRYKKLADRLGIKTTIHKLRHYSATEGSPRLTSERLRLPSRGCRSGHADDARVNLPRVAH